MTQTLVVNPSSACKNKHLQYSSLLLQNFADIICLIMVGHETKYFLNLFVFLVSRDCCVTLTRGAMGLSAACDCGIS